MGSINAGTQARRLSLGILVAAVVIYCAAAPAPALAAHPSVSVTGISSGATVSGSVTLGATTSSGATQTKWYIDNVEVGWDGSAPWQVTWNSARVSDGTHSIFAKAMNSRGEWGTSPSITFKVANSASGGTQGVAVTAPAAGATVSGSVTLTATASDPSGIKQVKWYIDGVEKGWDAAAPWQVSWNSSSVANGTHTIFAKAMTGTGAWLTSRSLSFNVQNGTTGGSGQWRLVMSDSFESSTLDTTKWMVYGPNWPGHNGNGLRDGRAVSVQNGTLTITARMLDGKLVSGAVRSRLDQTYGRFEFRARTDPDPTQTMSGVVLTWPQYQWSPEFTENDIYETLLNTTRNPLYTFIHYGNSSSSQKYFIHEGVDGSQWHHFAMEWEPTALRIYHDGALVWTVTDMYAIPDVAHHLVMQLDAFKPSLSGTVRLQVDDVRIYARA